MEVLKVGGGGGHGHGHESGEQEQQLEVMPASFTDSYKIAYIIHYFLGAGSLLPWNAFITAIDYFGYLYPGNHIERVFAVAYMSSSVLLLVIVVSSGGWSRRLSFTTRMNVGFFMFVASLMVAPVMDWTGSSCTQNHRAYVVTVMAVVVCGLADGLISGSLIGSAGKLPKRYMQAVFAGTASSGLVASILRIITKASLPRNPRGLEASSHLYFMVSIFILIACTASCNLLCKLPVMRSRAIHNGDDPPSVRPRFLKVVEKIRVPGLGIVLIYIVTLSIFPGFITEDLHSNILRDWYPVVLITTYNVADLVGKSLPTVYPIRSTKKATWACIGRLTFYPLFMACLHGPDWLKSEASMAILTFSLGLSNGYLTSVLMIMAPKSVPASEAELSAIIMDVFLGIGLVIGSVIGWFWTI